VVVTTPQEVALQDVRKEITFCRRVGLNVMGLVENMSSFVCPACNKGSTILPSTTGGATSLAQELSIPLLAKLPLDPKLGQASDQGENLFETHPESEVALAYKGLAESVARSLQS